MIRRRGEAPPPLDVGTRMGAAAGGEGEVVRVLVVDDSPVDRKVVELLLRNHRGGAAAFHGQPTSSFMSNLLLLC